MRMKEKKVSYITSLITDVLLCRRMLGFIKPKIKVKRICEIAVFPLAFLCMTGLLYHGVSNNCLRVAEAMKKQQHTRQYTTPVRRFDVILNSYMRAGSSFTGRLLGYRADSFYWYEPLWNFNCVVYYRGKEEVCSSNIHRCTNVVHPKTDVTKSYHRLSEMEEFLENIYRCNFTDTDKGVADGMTDRLSGKLWKPYQDCRKRNTTKQICMRLMSDACNQAKHRVTKVLRLSTDNLENILLRNPGIKVIHLFRDPRAVINSRLTTDWYYLKEDKNDSSHKAIRANANGLCRRMMYDFKAGLDLKRKFPTRFAFLLFEDIYSNIHKKSSDLYRYLGMTATDANDKTLNLSDIGKYEHTVVKKSEDFSSWWRTQMTFGAVKVVQDVCSDVFTIFPYANFSSERLMRNLDIPTWKHQPLFDTRKLVN